MVSGDSQMPCSITCAPYSLTVSTDQMIFPLVAMPGAIEGFDWKMDTLKSNKFIYLELNNFEDFPFGGTLSFSKQLLNVFRSEIAIVGIETGDYPTGCWIRKRIGENEFDYFGLVRINKEKRTIIPLRLKSVLFLWIYRKRIESFGIRNYFTCSPQFLFVLSKMKTRSLCFCFAGTTNLVAISKFKSLIKFDS